MLKIVNQEELVSIILSKAKRNHVDVNGIWVIGSYARGKRWPNDYDIYVYGDGESDDREHLSWDLEGMAMVTSWGALHIDPIAIYDDLPPLEWPKKRLWPPASWTLPYHIPNKGPLR